MCSLQVVVLILSISLLFLFELLFSVKEKYFHLCVEKEFLLSFLVSSLIPENYFWHFFFGKCFLIFFISLLFRTDPRFVNGHSIRQKNNCFIQIEKKKEEETFIWIQLHTYTVSNFVHVLLFLLSSNICRDDENKSATRSTYKCIKC